MPKSDIILDCLTVEDKHIFGVFIDSDESKNRIDI